MARPAAFAESERTQTLCRLTVPKSDADRLVALSRDSGSSQAWIRRRALREYLDRAERREPGARLDEEV